MQKSNYDTAYNILKKYIDNLSTSIHDQYSIGYFKDIMPDNIANPKWKFSLEALENTLSYIFKHLSHPCYALCVKNNKAIIYKLNMDSKIPAPIFQEVINNELIPSLNKNFEDGRITEEQKKYIEDTYISTNDIRIMQCILRPFSTGPIKITKNNIYNKVFDVRPIPNGVFILNLTDACILRGDGKEPFQSVLGDRMMEEKYRDADFLPILSQFSQQGYIDIPIPNYDDVDIVFDGVQPDGSYKHKEAILKSLNTSWNNKKYNKAVFRGGPAGCGYTEKTNMRIKLAVMQIDYPNDLNVGIVSKSNTIDSKRTVKIDPIYGLGMMNTGIKPVDFLDIQEQCKYKYIIHIDGNVNAYRLLETMRTGSLILRVKSEYSSWADNILIKAGEHYIEIEPDLSNLIETIIWCREHDKECKDIAENGLKISKQILTVSFIQGYALSVLWSLSDYRNKTASNTGYWEKMNRDQEQQQQQQGKSSKMPTEFIPPTKIIDELFLSQFNKYYELKNIYDEEKTQINIDTLHEYSSRKEKQLKFQQNKPKCISCERRVGTIFNRTIVDDLFTKIISAKCGDTITPCSLDIKIQFSGSEVIPNIITHYKEIIEQCNKDIIISKNNLFFGYNNEENVLKNFEDIKTKFNEIEPILTEYIKLFQDITNNPEKNDKIEKLVIIFYDIISDFKQQIIDYNDNRDPEYIVSLITRYINEFMPLLEEINKLKYKLNIVETITAAKDVGSLVQKTYTIEDIEIIIRPNANAILNFVMDSASFRNNSSRNGSTKRNKTLRKEKPKTILIIPTKGTEYNDIKTCLGVIENPDVSFEDKKRAYHKCSRKLHPDRGGKTEEFQQLSSAYEKAQEEEDRKNGI